MDWSQVENKRKWFLGSTVACIVLSAIKLFRYDVIIPVYLSVFRVLYTCLMIVVLFVEFIRIRRGVPAKYMGYVSSFPFELYFMARPLEGIEHTLKWIAYRNDLPSHLSLLGSVLISLSLLPLVIIEAIQWCKKKTLLTKRSAITMYVICGVILLSALLLVTVSSAMTNY